MSRETNGSTEGPCLSLREEVARDFAESLTKLTKSERWHSFLNTTWFPRVPFEALEGDLVAALEVAITAPATRFAVALEQWQEGLAIGERTEEG